MTNQSLVADKRGAARIVLATVMVILIVVSVFTSTAFAGYFDEYDVKIVENGEEITVTTTETEPIEILNKAGISLAKSDKLDLTAFNQGEGGTIVINRIKTINVEFGDKIKTYRVYSSTVGTALEEIGVSIDENDRINYNLTDNVQEGMVIDVKSAFAVSLTADGKTVSYNTVEGTVSDLLSFAGIVLDADDYTKPALDTALKSGMKIRVYRVEYKLETKTETLKYKTVNKNDSSLAQGKTKVITKGKNGIADVTYEVKYVDGKAASRKKTNSTVVVKASNEVVKVGTKNNSSVKANGVKSRNGFTVGQKISGRYTHYCACAVCNGNSRGITSSGRKIYNGMKNPYYIACNWLPLGSVINVKGHNYTVVDRGGKGLSNRGRIDIFTPEGHSTCYKYGTGSCTIEIVRLGW